MNPQTTLYTFAPGLNKTLGCDPTSKSANLAVVEKAAEASTKVLGRPHTIYRLSMGLWHSFKVVHPSEEVAKKAADKKAAARKQRKQEVLEGRRIPGEGNPFLALPEAQRMQLMGHLLKYLIPESRNLKDTPPSTWLLERIPELLTCSPRLKPGDSLN